MKTNSDLGQGKDLYSENSPDLNPDIYPTESTDIEMKTNTSKKITKTEISANNPERDKNLFPVYKGFIGECPEIKNVFKTIEKVAGTDSTVLISGESGTGKELTARAIHNYSSRCNKPMVVLNCGAIPSELLESELFGHEKGAFTGAHQTRIGRFELANGGTIFLDEIGDMSPKLQVKLLRVIQEQCFERVGSVKSINVDIRIISATNKNLKEAIKAETFREDLYYRLNVIPINMPPLRRRKSDIPLLIKYFLEKRHKINNTESKSFSKRAIDTLTNYNWPGNIRELENLIERLSILVEKNIIGFEDLSEKIRESSSIQKPTRKNISGNDWPGFTQAVNQFQKDLILQALNQTNWIKAKAANLLKMNRTTLVEKIKKMNLESVSESDSSNEFMSKTNFNPGELGISHLLHSDNTTASLLK